MNEFRISFWKGIVTIWTACAMVSCANVDDPMPDLSVTYADEDFETGEQSDRCLDEKVDSDRQECKCWADSADRDGDGNPDCADECPDDETKIERGECGCGEVDDDTDGDGILDCDDYCPEDPDKMDPGICGCGTPDDANGDDVADCMDLCEDDPEKAVPGICGCGVPDDDSDGDGTLDCDDGCPDDPGKTQPGQCDCGTPEEICTERPYIEISKPIYEEDESVVVSFFNLPRSKTNWIGTFLVGADSHDYLEGYYTGDKDSGTLVFSSMPAGNYEARLFFDDNYIIRDEITFQVH